MEKQQTQERTDIRLLSSLRDLRLNSKCNIILTQERKRQHKRLCPIKVRPEEDVIYENFKIVDKKKNNADQQFISKSLLHHFTFSSLITNKIMQEQLVDQFRLCKVDEKQYLLRQNDNASSFFILKQGELIVEVNGEQKGLIKTGEGFGQLALLYSTPRSASILAKKTSYLWFIDRSTFRNIVSTMIEKTFAQNKKFITNNKFFSYLTDKQKQKISSIAITQKYEKGTKICTQGQLASAMFIVKSGKLKRTVDGLCIGYYQNGDSLEEYAALSKNCVRKQTISAQEPTEIIAFGAEDIEKVLGRSLPLIILRNNAKKALMEDKNFKNLSKQLIEKVIDCFKIKNMSKGDHAFKSGDFCKNKIIFIIEGQYQMKKGQSYGALFGSQCAKSENRMVTYDFSCVFKTEGKIAQTTIQDIQQSIGTTIGQAVQKSISMKKSMQNRRSKLIEFKNIAKDFILKDFSVVKKLGQGQFGQVFLVSYPKSNKFYALKCISKSETLRYKLQKHLINEKKVLQMHSSPFTVDFIRSFNDENYVYFLMEFIDGLEMFDALRIIGLVPPALAKFYAAIILHTIQSLHTNNIIYRDLKPENIMVQTDGYLKIIDMGTCKYLKSSSSTSSSTSCSPTGKTFTIIGTPNYMAPQILSGKGYNYSVDLWSLGVIIFEFLAGYLPFGQHCEDPYQIYQEILTTQLKFPKYMNDVMANGLIMRLLNRNCEARLGESYSELKNHDFFKQIQWSQLVEKKIVPCFKPPKEYLMKIDSLPKNLRTIDFYLKHIPYVGPKRTDINPNWDNCF